MKTVIRFVAQIYANLIIASLENIKDPMIRDSIIQQGIALDAYCIVFHNIYLN
jgi:hypothetical protein